jgi:ribonuclease T2
LNNLTGWFGVCVLFMPAIAQALAYQCRLPPPPLSVPTVTRDGLTRQRPVTGYTLALSWSPEYCRNRQTSAADRWQCSGRSGRFGFVVHGLRPEGRGGDWPQWCPARRPLTGVEVARNMCMTPSARLLAEEWAKHGACMSYRPESYFRITRILWRSLRWPDFDRLSRDEALTVGDVRRALTDANPAWKPENVGVGVNERGWLTELRLCYARTFMPARCDARRLGASDAAPVKIWRGL